MNRIAEPKDVAFEALLHFRDDFFDLLFEILVHPGFHFLYIGRFGEIQRRVIFFNNSLALQQDPEPWQFSAEYRRNMALEGVHTNTYRFPPGCS
ncbi:hypothetical protein D3C73_1387790 [compost metagenome]